MSENKDKEWLKKLFAKKEEGKKKITLFHYFIMVLCLGVALMILGSFFSSDDDKDEFTQPVYEDRSNSEEAEAVFGQKDAEPHTMADYEMHYENQLKKALEEIVGVSNVTVMVNLADTERRVYEKNVSVKKQLTDETDREGGTRKVDDTTRDEQIVIVRSGDKEEPLMVATEKPEIRGVLVVAEGVQNMQTKAMVVEAVSRVLDVPSHRVSVQPKKVKGE